jgi:excisionase family DNA binding protein
VSRHCTKATKSNSVIESGEFRPADLLSIEEVAKRLHVEVSWVREKIRRRSPNPMPCYNLGRHLLFDWQAVSNWIRKTGRGAPHAKHSRRRAT